MKFYLLTIFLGGCIVSCAQMPTQTITIDFFDLKNTSLIKKVKKGSLVNIELTNLNRRQYNVQVNNTQTNFFTTTPPIFSRLETATPAIADPVDIQVPGSNLNPLTVREEIKEEVEVLSRQQTSFNGLLNQFNTALADYNKAIGVLKNSLLLSNILTTLSDDCSRSFPTIIVDVNTEASSFVSNNKIGPENAGTTESVLRGQVQNILDYYQKSAAENFEALQKLAEQIEATAITISGNIPLLAKKIDVELGKKLTPAVKASFDGYKLIIDKLGRNIKKDVNSVQLIMKTVGKANDFTNNYLVTNQRGILLNKYAGFTAKNYTVRTAEIISKDELLFDITITPKPDANCPSEILHLPIKVRSVGGFKIDFSSGLFLNFGKKDFFNQSYRLDTVENNPDVYQIVKNENRNKVIPSIGALLHGYIRTGGDIQPAVSIGLSLSAGETARLNYHFGGSVIIGKEQRIIASVGWSLVQSTILDGKYKEGQTISKTDAPDVVPVSPYYRWGSFFSLTYNLTR